MNNLGTCLKCWDDPCTCGKPLRKIGVVTTKYDNNAMSDTPTPTDENPNMITPNQRLQNGQQIFVAKMEILMEERTREIRKASGELLQEVKQLKAELTAAREELKRTDFALSQASIIYDVVVDQRDRLAVALKEAASLAVNEPDFLIGYFLSEDSPVREALQSLNQPTEMRCNKALNLNKWQPIETYGQQEDWETVMEQHLVRWNTWQNAIEHPTKGAK